MFRLGLRHNILGAPHTPSPNTGQSSMSKALKRERERERERERRGGREAFVNPPELLRFQGRHLFSTLRTRDQRMCRRRRHCFTFSLEEEG